MKKSIIVLISTIIIGGFLGCDFFLGPDEPVGRSGNLSIRVGTGDSRAISSGKDLPEEVRASLRYDITLTGPGGETIERTLADGENLQLTVALGEWRIGAAARQEGGETVVGTGSLVFTVIPGINAVRVPMTLENYYYSITLPDLPNGIVEANVSAAFPETLVTLTVRPGNGYILKALTYSYGDTDISIEESESGYIFTMPAADITVHAEFEGSYSISGTISTDVPGGPANNASVQLKQDGGNVGSPVSTEANGAYTIPNVVPGSGYTIEVSLTGYTTGGSSPFGVTGNVTDKDLTLAKIFDPVYTVSGTISADNPAGAVSGASVQLKQSGAPVGNAVSTGTDGTYTIPDVPAGEGYTIEVSLAGYAMGTSSSFDITTANVTGQNLTLVRIVYTVSGTITTNNSGGSANNANVQLKQDGGNVGSPVSTEANGAYTILNVVPGSGYTIEVSLAGYTTGVSPSFGVAAANVTGQDLTLVRIVYTVSGTITTNNPGGPANNASVQLKQDGVNVGSPVSTEANGAYTIPNIVPGNGYTIEVSLTGYTTGGSSPFGVAAANVTGQNLMLVKILDPVYTVSGTISADNPVGAVSGASVQLKQSGDNVGNAVTTGMDGTYTIPEVPAGSGYTIEVSLAGYTTGGSSPFGVTTANVTGQNLTLVRIVYTVSGTITTNNPGGSANNASVQLKQDEGNVGSPVITGTDGVYTIPDVVPGNGYTIEVSLAGYTMGTSSSFDITTANVTGQNLTLVRIVYTVSGTITTDNPGGAAIGASVQLKQSGSNVGNAVITGTDGTYTIPNVVPGNGYTIEVSLAGYNTGGTSSSFSVTGNVTGKDLELVRIVYTVSGTINTDNPGGAAIGASVQLKQSGSNVGNAVITGTDGVYTIPNVVPGDDYTIEVSLAGYNTGTSSSFSVTGDTGKDLELVRIVYDITVDTLSHGAISANPASATVGTLVTLTVTPDTNYVLKSGTLKYRYEGVEGEPTGSGPTYTFTMPASNVTVHAEFNRVLGFTIKGPEDLMVGVTEVYSYSDNRDPPAISWTAREYITFTVDSDAYTAEAGNLKWLVNGEDVTATGNSLVIEARNYILRTYTLMVMIQADDTLWYSRETDFTVQE